MKGILLIHKNEVEHTVLAQLFRQHQWKVWQAGDPDSAYSLAREHRPEIVVVDLEGLSHNGLKLCADIRADHEAHKVYILTLSEPNSNISQTNIIKAGAHELLIKPVPPEELLRLVEIRVNVGTAEDPPAAETDWRGTTLRFWGVRGSIPAPGPTTLKYGGNTSCIELRADGEIIVLDSGSGIRLLGHELTTEFKLAPLKLTILISHTHWDHIQGFPFFLPAYDRKNRIRIIGQEGSRDGLTRILSMQMEGPYFPIDFKELPSNIVIEDLKKSEFMVGRVQVRTMFTNHPGMCVGYRITTSQGSIVYLPDNEPCYLVHPQARQELGDLPDGLSPAKAQEKLTFDFVQGADILIMDSQYDTREYKSHMGWGHGCVDDVVALAIQAQVKRLYLFHHDPDHDDAKLERMVDYARSLATQQGSTLMIDAAREGECCKLIRD